MATTTKSPAPKTKAMAKPGRPAQAKRKGSPEMAQDNMQSKTNPMKKSPAASAKSGNASKTKRNQKTETAQDNMQLTDFDIASDVLSTHKALISKYGQAIYEISCPQLRKIVNSQLTECAIDQLDCFNYMHDRGMYKTETAPVSKIKQARQKYTGALSKGKCGK